MKQILLIEDEAHKKEEITGYLKEFLGSDLILSEADSVREAVMAVTENNYDLIVLDMALPTFTASCESISGGLDQALGGVEVLRSLKALGKELNVVIVTQYPDISLGGKRIKLKAAKTTLEKKYGQKVRGTVLYKYKSSLNRSKIKTIVDSIW
ncbi:response regulator [Tritonibacter scottomollicae]|uniref:Response regulator receiver domain-containing protein n=1 Tax=Tritonibacter scottomollicae TaxID=483013 RepID=A0A2T1AAI0_TRISK|nr:response regulator [Tritonibacter scottomollicae]PRZ45613.1 response regulator receiver domain-containing protein [Tritonibacter scottomollicae]